MAPPVVPLLNESSLSDMCVSLSLFLSLCNRAADAPCTLRPDFDFDPDPGLAMINGTQFISSLGAEAVVQCRNLVCVADVVGALSLEVLKGTHRAFDEKVRHRPVDSS